jgi:uncharacterized protein (DUF1501 family)
MDRREFIRRGGALSAAGLAANLDLLSLNAHAAVSDYKALVCVFLFGGVDGNNVLVPLDTAGYGDYAKVRGATSGIQLTQAELLPIALGNPQKVVYRRLLRKKKTLESDLRKLFHDHRPAKQLGFTTVWVNRPNADHAESTSFAMSEETVSARCSSM